MRRSHPLITLLLACLAPAVARAQSMPPPVLAAPESVPLATSEGATIEVRFDAPPQSPVLVASVGRVDRLVQQPQPGRYLATYLPPLASEQPLAVLAAWDEGAPGVPGIAKIRLDRSEGEEPAAPGVRAAVFVVPRRLAFESPSPGRVHVFVYDDQGTPQDVSPTLRTERGTATEVERLGPGIFAADYQPPAVVGSVADSVSALLDEVVLGWDEVVVTGIELGTFELTATPPAIVADGFSKADLRLTLKDRFGNPLSGHPVAFETAQGVVVEATDQGDGTWTATYVSPDALPERGTVEVVAIVGEAVPGEEPPAATVDIRLSAGPPANVTVWSEPRVVPADGRTKVSVLATLADALGNPAEGRPELKLSEGELRPMRMDGPGRWRAAWTPPRVPDLMFARRVEVTATVEGNAIEVRGGLRIDPPGAQAQAPRELPDAVWGADAGLLTLFGSGRFGATSGFSVSGEWASRIGATSLYVGVVPGVCWATTSVVGKDPSHLAEGVSEVEADVEQLLIPVVATATVRVKLSPVLDLRGGLAAGLLPAWVRTTSELALGGAAASFDLLGLFALPVGVELPLGDGRLTAQVEYFRSLGGLTGVTGGGAGVVGTVQGASASIGWRWTE